MTAPRIRLIGLPTDAVELHPPRDLNGITAALAARLV